MNYTEALRSHSPLSFACEPQAQAQAQGKEKEKEKAQARAEMPPPSASRVLFVSGWKLNCEAARDQPRLRKMLGHLSVYDEARLLSRAQTQDSEEESDANELSTYLQQQVPSFKEFQAALELQLATMAEVKAATDRYELQLATMAEVNAGTDRYNAEGYISDEEVVDSDDDSYDVECSDDDATAESDDSLTDYESVDGQWSTCSSPTSCCEHAEHEEDENDLWAVRPPIPFRNRPLDSRPG